MTPIIVAVARGRGEASVAKVYARDAVLETILDGASLGRNGFAIRKRLLAATTDTIVNDWEGEIAGRPRARRIEVWRFREGRVVHHTLYSYLDVRDSRRVVARLRLALGYPRVAISLLRAAKRAA